MAKHTRLTPRKQPRQERSRATVDAILQAATYILVKSGWAALTTNAVAERAGVNIASLYQFFPTKEAIVAELERRHIAETRAKIAEVYVRHRGDGLEARVRTLVDAAVAAHLVAPELHRVFSDELPRRREETVEEPPLIDRADKSRLAKGVPQPALASWLIETVAHAAVHEGIVERRSDVQSGALADELVKLLVRYLER